MNNIKLIQGDITQLDVDAVVNAGNSSLMGGGGVDGAIHRAGGPAILEECRRIVARQGGCHTGEAVMTTGGRLPARYVIHTVGPVWNGGTQGEAGKLANCYYNAIELAVLHGLSSVAFPNISTGIYGYPRQQAAEVAIQTVGLALEKHPQLQVTFVCFDDENFKIYQRLLG